MSELLISDLLILLVEPSTMQRRVIFGYLNNFGIDNIDLAESGSKAFEIMNNAEPDLIISSMHLPDMTGADLLIRMRENSELAHVPFMLISSETNYRYLEPIRQAGAIALLPKPFEPEQLHHALHSTLDLIDPKIVELNSLSPEEVHVLLVDDSKMSRRHITRVLNNMGILKITEAENGVQAVNLMNEAGFDLVVTDYNMPEMDGKEFIQYVREKSSQSAVPIVMVTSTSDESRLAMVEQVGVSAICDKPFEPSNIREILKKVI